MVSTTAVPVQAKTLFYILISLPEKEIMESANYFEVEPSTKKKAWEGARGTAVPCALSFCPLHSLQTTSLRAKQYEIVRIIP